MFIKLLTHKEVNIIKSDYIRLCAIELGTNYQIFYISEKLYNNSEIHKMILDNLLIKTYLRKFKIMKIRNNKLSELDESKIIFLNFFDKYSYYITHSV
jgi:hypothetical protein